MFTGINTAIGRNLGTAGRTALYGGMLGGAYGALSSDTSVLGGAAFGVGLGLAGRYGRAGLRSAWRASAGGYNEFAAFRGGVTRRMWNDVRSVGMRANRGYNRFSGLFTTGYPGAGI